jgi:hypothetical protein
MMSSSKGKRPATESVEELKDSLEKSRWQLKKAKKDLKPRTSFDGEYWAKAVELLDLKRQTSDIGFRKAKLEYEGSEEDFLQSDIAKNFIEDIKICETEGRIYQKQAARVKTSSPERSLRRSFMQLFTSSHLGLDISDSRTGHRDNSKQSNFRAAIIKEYGLKDTRGKKYEDLVWNIITARPEIGDEMVASHIFAYRHGQETMTAIFGKDCKDELFSARNGLLLPKRVEAQLEKGLFAIVPAVKDMSSKAEISLWAQTHPHDYKIKILDPGRPICEKLAFTDPKPITWGELDGVKLSFPNSFRPRARYLYFNYCCQLLRLAWSAGANAKSLPTLKAELGLKAWGTAGKYFAANQMRAFADELGHDYAELREGADETPNEETEEEQDTLLAAVTGQIRESLRPKDDNESEDYDDDDDDE